MTAAAAPLKMTTPSAVDTEVICYILKKRITDIISDLGSNEVETEEENESEYRVAFITFSSLPLPLPFTTKSITELGELGCWRGSSSSSRGRW